MKMASGRASESRICACVGKAEEEGEEEEEGAAASLETAPESESAPAS